MFSKIFKFIFRHKRLSVFLILLMAGGVFLGRHFLKKPAVVKTYTVERKTLETTISATGKVKAKNQAELHFLAPSKIVWLGVKKGDQVKAWQGLASVDRRQLEKNWQEKLLDYAITRWDFEQLQDDYSVGGRPLEKVILTAEEKRILEKSQFGLDKSVLAVEIAALAAREAVLVSPIAGTVVAVENLTVGENLTAGNLGTSYIKIVDFDSLYFEAEIDEIDYPQVKQDQKAKITLDAFPGTEFAGSVNYVGQEGTESSGGIINILAEISFGEIKEPLITGLNGEAKFILDEKENVLVVPREFLTFEKDKVFVYLLETTKPERREVKLGVTTSAEAEVVEGVAESETLALLAD